MRNRYIITENQAIILVHNRGTIHRLILDKEDFAKVASARGKIGVGYHTKRGPVCRGIYDGEYRNISSVVMEVDKREKLIHINDNSLDCRKCNLRISDDYEYTVGHKWIQIALALRVPYNQRFSTEGWGDFRIDNRGLWSYEDRMYDSDMTGDRRLSYLYQFLEGNIVPHVPEPSIPTGY